MPSGWTSYLHWQGVLDALRGRRAGEIPAARPVTASESASPFATPRPEPRAALPDRRHHSPSEASAIDGWLDSAPD